MYSPLLFSDIIISWPVLEDHAAMSALVPGSVEIILSTCPSLNFEIAIFVLTIGNGQDKPLQFNSMSKCVSFILVPSKNTKIF